MLEKKRTGGLGKNLNALLSQMSNVKNPLEQNSVDGANDAILKYLPTDQLRPGKYQPRRHIAEEALQELAESIREQGMLQPIVVRAIGYEQYEIIAGERRWRAAKMISLTTIPTLVHVLSDQKALALALIENIQREDLSPMEEAYALHRLIEEFSYTHQQAAQVLGKSRTNITNTLRLMNLTASVKQFLEEKKLEMGHARALLMLSPEQQHQAAQIVIAKNLSVRETEQLVKNYRQQPKTEPKKAQTTAPDPNLTHFQTTLSERLGAKVLINHDAKGAGSLIIYYNNLSELDGIVDHII